MRTTPVRPIRRRAFLAAVGTAAALPSALRDAGAATPAAVTPAASGAVVNVRTWTAPEAGAYRNVHAIETGTGFVVIDVPLRRSDGDAARAWLASLGEPVRGVLVRLAETGKNPR